MIAAVQLVLEECEDTESDVLVLASDLEKYGFDKVNKVSSLTDLINRKGRGGYSRV